MRTSLFRFRFVLVAILFAGQALGSVVVNFTCDSSVEEVGEYDELSGILKVTIQAIELREDFSESCTTSFIESLGEHSIQISIENVTPEDLEHISSGVLLQLEYMNVSGIFGTAAEPGAFSSESWTLLEICVN